MSQALPWAEAWAAWTRRTRRFLDAGVLRARPQPIWHTPNRVVLERPAWRLRDFSEPSGANAARNGLAAALIVPPEVNQSCIADFGPDQSLVQTVRSHGFPRVAAIEWKSATAQTADRDVDDSLEAILESLEALGGSPALIGLCQGGWEAAMAVALRPGCCSSLTLVAAPIDFHAGLGMIRWLSAAMPMSAYQALVQLGGGVMKGEYISQGFDNLLPFERYALKGLALWNHLDEDEWMERFHRLEDWYRAPKDLPGKLYLRAVRELFKENRLIQRRFVALGETVDLARIRCALALVAGSQDHITPPPQVWAAKAATRSSRVLEVEIPAGHVGTFMGRSALQTHWPRVLSWLRESTTPAT